MLKKILTKILSVVAALVLAVGMSACGVPHDRTVYETDLPVINIDTFGKKIKSKETYVDCTVSITNVEDEFIIDGVEAGIRLRGNSTMQLPKKPYRIKFSSKQSPFGWKKNKSWVLLAMYLDSSNIKDYAAFGFANAIGSNTFVPNAKHVEVYLNGEYQGLYLFCDQVDEKSGRTDVEDEDFFETSSVEAPFLVELDGYASAEGEEDVVWFKIENNDGTSLYNVKYPEFDDGYNYTKEQFNYIKSYIKTVDGICRNPEVTREEFEEWIDLPSFIDYYLIQEFMGQTEINWKSVYMSKAVGGKLKMGPVWDFDWSAGGPIGKFQGKNYDGKNVVNSWQSTNNWFAHMLQVDWFKAEVSSRWTEIEPTLLKKVNELAEYKPTIAAAAERSAVLWKQNHRGKNDGFNEYYDWVIDYFRHRAEVIGGLLAG